MRSKKSLYNLLAAMLLQIVMLLVGIILPRVMLMCFGSEINGLVSSIRQFINYLTLVEAGLAGACVYSLYKPLADKNYTEINRILSSTKKFYNKAGMIFSMLALLLAVCFPYIVKSESIGNSTIILLVLILGINGSLEFFSMGKYRALLTADQKSYVIALIQVCGQVINCVIISIMSLSGYGIVSVQFIATVSYLVRSILFSIYVNKKYSLVDFNVKTSKKVLHQRWDVLFHQIGGMVVINSPIAVITLFSTLVEVSIYSVYNMVFAGVAGIVSIFNSGVVAGIGDIISRGDIKCLQRVYNEYECGYYMIMTWIYSCTYILILPFITIYTAGIQDANYINPHLTIAFTIIGVLNSMRVPQSTVVSAAGHFKETRYKALAEVIINLVASIILVNYLGMIGVLIGGMCSYAYRTIDYIIYTPKNITHISVKQTLTRIVRMIGIGTVIIIPFKVIIDIQTNNIIEWIIWGAIVAIWSGIVVLIGNYIGDRCTMQSIIKRILMVVRLTPRN